MDQIHSQNSTQSLFLTSEPFNIELQNIKKGFYFNRTWIEVLKGIHLSIPQSSIVGFIGKSGAGKTTLLRCLNLLEKPSEGHIKVGKVDLTTLSENQLRKFRHNVGMVFQSFNLLNCRTVFGNLALPLEIQGIPADQIRSKVIQMAQWVGLETKLTHYPSQLSGGQKQRVAIGRALITNSKILLCDEFTSALDPQTTLEILNLIRSLHAQLQLTVVLVSHDMSVIKEICDTVYVLDSGEIVESGTVKEILYFSKNPATLVLTQSLRAASFVTK